MTMLKCPGLMYCLGKAACFSSRTQGSFRRRNGLAVLSSGDWDGPRGAAPGGFPWQGTPLRFLSVLSCDWGGSGDAEMREDDTGRACTQGRRVAIPHPCSRSDGDGVGIHSAGTRRVFGNRGRENKTASQCRLAICEKTDLCVLSSGFPCPPSLLPSPSRSSLGAPAGTSLAGTSLAAAGARAEAEGHVWASVVQVLLSEKRKFRERQWGDGIRGFLGREAQAMAEQGWPEWDPRALNSGLATVSRLGEQGAARRRGLSVC